MIKSRLNHKLMVFSCIIVLFFSYFAQANAEFAFADDYSFLYETNFGDSNALLKHDLAEGRYLSGLFQTLGFMVFSDLSSIRFLRLLSLLGIALLFIILLQTVKLSLSTVDSIALISMLFLLPVFSQYVTFAVTWVAPWAILCSFLATKALIESEKTGIGIVFPLTFTALSFSQTYPFWSYTFIGLFLLLGQIQLGECVKKSLKMTAIIVSAFILQAVLQTVLEKSTGIEISDRIETASLHEIPTKLTWFFTRVIVSAYRPYFIDSPTAIEAALISGAFFSLGFYVYMKVNKSGEIIYVRKKLLGEILLIQILIVLSVSPLLVWGQNQIEFRLFGAGSFLALSFVLIPSLNFMRLANKKIGSLSLLVLLPVTFLSVLSLARANELRVEPYKAKHDFIRESIEACYKQGVTETISYIIPNEWPSRVLLGDYSVGTDLQMSWVPKPSIALEIYNTNRKFGYLEVTGADQKRVSWNGICTLDFRKFIEVNLTELTSSRPLLDFGRRILQP